MKDARKTPKVDSPRQRRAQRRARALVTNYIHELSDRHRGTPRREPAVREGA